MNTLNIGLIGCGAIAQLAHIPYLTNDETRFRLVALADTHAPTLEAVANHHHIEQRFTDWREMLRLPELDAVVICHAGSHRESVLAALDAEKHVFCEKPLAWNVREVEEVAARAARSNRIVQVGYHKLYDPAFAYAREHLHQMRDLAYGQITVLHPWNDLGLSMHRIRRGDGLFREGHIEPGDFAEQPALHEQGLAGGDLAPLTDEALGERKGDQRLRVAYGITTISLIHQVYTLFGFLGAPSRIVEATCWRGGLSIHALFEYPNDFRLSLDWHHLHNLKDYREEYAFYSNHERLAFQLPSPYFLHFPSPVTIQGHDGELAWEKRVIVSYAEAFQEELRAFHHNVITQQQPTWGKVSDAVAHSRFIQQLIEQMR
jgi:predicted dehydrogenase